MFLSAIKKKVVKTTITQSISVRGYAEQPYGWRQPPRDNNEGAKFTSPFSANEDLSTPMTRVPAMEQQQNAFQPQIRAASQVAAPFLQQQQAPFYNSNWKKNAAQSASVEEESSSSASKTPFNDENDDYHAFSHIYENTAKEGFSAEITQILQQPVPEDLIETRQEMLYLPEIQYRRILSRAFGAGGWALIPRGPHSLNNKMLSREYALVCHGRCVSIARGTATLQMNNSLSMASESVKSNALMRTCKDLGIASELWDVSFIEKFKKAHNIGTRTARY